MPDTLPPSVPTGSARAARTAGKKLEFARQYCSQCPVPIQLISRHARSLEATRKLQRIRTHKKRNRESPNGSRFQALCQSQQTAKLAAREWPLSAHGRRSGTSRQWPLSRLTNPGEPQIKTALNSEATAAPVPTYLRRDDKTKGVSRCAVSAPP